MDYYWFNLLEKQKIKRFIRFVYSYCKKYKLKSLKQFFNHNYNGFSSDTYRFLYVAPKTLLVCSYSFFEFYSKLEIDFRNDIMTYEEYNEMLKIMRENKDLAKYIKKMLGEDMVNNVYTTSGYSENYQ